MLSVSMLIGFIVAALVVLIIPGPGVMYVVARSVAQGRRAGLVSALGLSVGVLAHVGAAVIGLSALLLTSATAFTIVKLIGAGYLIYLGLQTLLAGRQAHGPPSLGRQPLRRLFRDGVLVSVFNPKIAAFFLAFLPQFVDPASGAAQTQIVLLGVLYAGLAFVTDGTYALLAGGLRNWLGGALVQGPWLRYVSGSLLLGLGAKAALTAQRS